MTMTLQLDFDGPEGPRQFRDPLETLVALTPSQGFRALDRAEEAIAQGYAVAGMISFEWGYACLDLPNPYAHADPSIANSPIPLLHLGVYAPISDVQRQASKSAAPAHSGDSFGATSAFVARVSRADYQAALAEIHRLLYEGSLYQLNYTVPFDLHFTGEAAELYRSLGPQSHAPYRALLQSTSYALVSLSPELFLRFEADRLTTKPMKGTSSPLAEHELAAPKNRAEHVMIVDLLRNDLGRVCTEVRVSKLLTTERYPTFSTLTSTIEGHRRPQTPLREIFRALFPCGSVTGAPKRAAMQEIGRLEHSPRGAYCGTLGYLLPNGTGSWNVAIRTLQLDLSKGLARLDLGGGIVADSEGETEWNELLLKGKLYTRLASLLPSPAPD